MCSMQNVFKDFLVNVIFTMNWNYLRFSLYWSDGMLDPFAKAENCDQWI